MKRNKVFFDVKFQSNLMEQILGFHYSGYLFHGPEGVGKTFFIKNILLEDERFKNNEEIEVKYFSSIKDIYEERIGSSENNVFSILVELQKEISQEERKKYIIIFDDFDLVACKSKKLHRVNRLVCCEFLHFFYEISRMEQRENSHRITIIAICSSENIDQIDKEFFGFGKLEKTIFLPLPNPDHRMKILRDIIPSNFLIKSENLESIVEKTHGFSIGDLLTTVKYFVEKKSIVIPDSLLRSKNEMFSESSHSTISLKKSIRELRGCYDDDLLDSIQFSILDPFSHPEKYRDVGINPPRGILFHGPPGCGKTYLAKLIVGEIKNACFISVSCVDLLSKVVGRSSRKISDLFRLARLRAPCVLFFDQFETVARRRGGSGRSMDQMLSTLLIEMDGIFVETRQQQHEDNTSTSSSQVVVFAATNRKDLLDPAVLRPGRLDLHLEIGNPKKEQIGNLLRSFIKDIPVEEEILNLIDDEYSEKLENSKCSIAQIEGIVRETSMKCIVDGKKIMTKEYFEYFLNQFCVQ